MKKTLSIKKIAVIAAILVAAVAGVVIFIFSQRLTATTMRLLKIQGIVKLFDKEKEKTIIDNIHLASGNAITTDANSLASIALDDAKVVTMNDLSRAQFEQSGKKLNIKLTDGSLFFEVSKKLAADETFDIRTSSMVVGIRGTSGYVAVDEEGHETLYITDGEVEVIGTNPVTGEQKVIRVKAGQRIRVYLYNDRPKDSIMFSLEDVSEDDLRQAIKDRLIENEPLLAKVCNATGWDKNKILGIELIPEDVVPTSAGDFIEDYIEEKEVASAAASSSEEEIVEEKAEEVIEEVAIEEPIEEPKVAAAAPAVTLPDVSEFDPSYYASHNQDVVDNYGTDPEALYQHYQEFGEGEGRAATQQQAQEQQSSNSSQDEAYQQFQQDLARAQEEQAEQERLEQQQRLDQQAMQNALNQANNMNQDNGQDDTNYVDNNSTQVNNTQRPNNDYNPYADPNSELYDPDNTNPDNPNYIDPETGDPNNDPGNDPGDGTGGP